MGSSAQSCLTLCHPVDCSMPGLPVHLQDMDIQYMDILGTFIQPIIDSFYSAFLSFFKHFQAFIYYLMPDMQAHTHIHTHTHTHKHTHTHRGYMFYVSTEYINTLVNIMTINILDPFPSGLQTLLFFHLSISFSLILFSVQK